MAGIAKTPMICDGVDATTGVGSCLIGTTSAAATVIIVLGGLIGLFFGLWQFFQVRNIDLPDGKDPNATKQLRDEANNPQPDESTGLTGPVAAGKEDEVLDSHFEKLVEIYGYVRTGAESFLMAQYSLCLMFTVVFSIIVLVLCSSVNNAKGEHEWDFGVGGLTATSFAVGAITSIISGYLGMTVAVYANARVTVEAVKPNARGWRGSFNAAFIAGSVMGFALCGLALLMLFVLVHLFTQAGNKFSFAEPKVLFECISGYGLGGSSMALFGRVGGGIFTKAADVGADLSGKVAGVPKRDDAGAIVMKDGQPEMQLFDEDSPYNPATIADNVGDNVGDVAGMGSDLFGSFAEASCAALVISASSAELVSGGYTSLMFPMAVSAAGIVMCMLTSFLATHAMEVSKHQDVEKVLKVQLFVSAVLMTAAVYPIAHAFLPDKFTFQDYKQITTNAKDAAKMQECTRLGAWACVVCGLWGGCLIGFITEYYTSHSYEPVREVAMSCNQGGAATNIIYGLALGYLSTIIPIVLLAVNVYVAFSLCGMYGVALAALGMLGTLSTCLSIDVYGPIADNAGGLAEMAEFPSFVRDKTDALDAAGNTTAAIGKGFAIGSAALVSLALFGGFVSRLAGHAKTGVQIDINVLRPVTFAFLFLGAMLPYWFTAFCMKSVGLAAGAMVQNVKEQFEANGAAIMKGAAPDYQACIKISTDASLKEMIAPGMLVMFSPLITGVFFGVEAVCGLLVGSLVSAVQLAISQSNSGGAWDNAKKFVESNQLIIDEPSGELDEDGQLKLDAKGKPLMVAKVHGKKTDVHKAAVVGDTVGDPLKDTSGPALNIVMKLMAILSLVFSDFFVSINHGQGVFKIATTLDLSGK